MTKVTPTYLGKIIVDTLKAKGAIKVKGSKPASPSKGDLVVSGNGLYFYDGSAWKQAA